VHNTLGRLWLGTHPGSGLAERLDYLVPVRNGFPASGQPLKIEELKLLDPACGSGHFLLEAFDLLFEMWREACPEMPPWQIPAKILENNLYGVDIDLRACQIAALALYLKARTLFEAYKDAGAVFRPARINIVCADVRFTDGGRRQAFLAYFENRLGPTFRKAVEKFIEAAANAFSIGSLLKTVGPIEEALAAVSVPVTPGRRGVQVKIFGLPELVQEELRVPAGKGYSVQEILELIREYIRQASAKNDMGTLFFGLDAEKAVHLIDVLSERYDIILMNPPYGAMPAVCKNYAREHYPRTHSDYYAAFIEQAVNLTRPGGYIGALTGRTFLFLKSFQRLREEILRRDALPEVVLDLGFNVLDGATARWAAFTLRKRWPGDGVRWQDHPVAFFRLTPWQWDEKRVKFEEALAGMAASGNVSRTVEGV